MSVCAAEITGGVNGDVNNDGFTDSADLIAVREALLEIKTVDDFDVNYDKSEDLKDLVRLKNYLVYNGIYGDNDFDVNDL